MFFCGCEKYFTRQYNLTAHIKRKHGGVFQFIFGVEQKMKPLNTILESYDYENC